MSAGNDNARGQAGAGTAENRLPAHHSTLVAV